MSKILPIGCSKKAREIHLKLNKLEWFNDVRDDKRFIYYYFPPNDSGANYGIKLNKATGEISAVMYAVNFWDIDIEMDDLFSNVTNEVANDLIFNLDLFR